MRLTKHRHRTTAEMNMTPMIDVVFLLIIFFMTVSQVSIVNRERIPLPKLPGTEDQEPKSLTVNVNRDGDVIVSGNTVTIAQLVAILSRELLAVGDDPNRIHVTVRADQNGQSRGVNRVVTALARLQIKKVHVAVEVPD